MRSWRTLGSWWSLKEKLLVRKSHSLLSTVNGNVAADMIEKNVEDVGINVDEGNRNLEKGVTYKVCSLVLSLPDLMHVRKILSCVR